MPEKYVQAILKYLSDRDYQPLKPRQLARQMGVADEDYGSFRQAVKMLRDSGRVALGARNAVMLPQMSARVVGTFRANARGFGFVIPETPNAHGDLYIPEGAGAGAMTGDTVVARVVKRGKRGGEMIYHGRIVEIVARGASRLVGTLAKTEGAWFVLPDGKAWTAPVVIADVGPGAAEGQKVVAEIITYPGKGDLARGVIVETIGSAGAIEAETLSIIRAHGLADAFGAEQLAEARAAVEAFDPDDSPGREDLTAKVIVTIDPPDARDFDDAVSVQPASGGGWVLGVHIADVSNFVAEDGPLDVEARDRGNSVYFPRKVLPMLPEILANGVCSLQQDQKRFCKSVFIRYDGKGNVTGRRGAETVIRSSSRLTYQKAQAILDGKAGGYPAKVVELVRRMQRLARLIEARRTAEGMIHLEIPSFEPVLDKAGKAVDAVPEDESYTHTIIEMFMVEANEAAASLLQRGKGKKGGGVPFLRRIHPSPDAASGQQLASFVRVCGHKLPRKPTRQDIQNLLSAVKGRPESFAVNLAVLKSFEQAEYSPMPVGHFALASPSYCHFTSPIRRYADLTVHRLLHDLVRGRGAPRPDVSQLVKLGEHCSMTERRAEAAEAELVTVLMLQLLAGKVGERFDGVVTGVTNFGVFVQLLRFGVDGLIRMADLGDDWWELSARTGELRGERSGRRFRIGDALTVRIASVNVPGRQLNLSPLAKPAKSPKDAKPAKAAKPAKQGQATKRARAAKSAKAAKPARFPARRRNK